MDTYGSYDLSEAPKKLANEANAHMDGLKTVLRKMDLLDQHLPLPNPLKSDTILSYNDVLNHMRLWMDNTLISKNSGK